jgi:hypothetical protein
MSKTLLAVVTLAFSLAAAPIVYADSTETTKKEDTTNADGSKTKTTKKSKKSSDGSKTDTTKTETTK